MKLFYSMSNKPWSRFDRSVPTSILAILVHVHVHVHVLLLQMSAVFRTRRMRCFTQTCGSTMWVVFSYSNQLTLIIFTTILSYIVVQTRMHLKKYMIKFFSDLMTYLPVNTSYEHIVKMQLCCLFCAQSCGRTISLCGTRLSTEAFRASGSPPPWSGPPIS